MQADCNSTSMQWVACLFNDLSFLNGQRSSITHFTSPTLGIPINTYVFCLHNFNPQHWHVNLGFYNVMQKEKLTYFTVCQCVTPPPLNWPTNGAYSFLVYKIIYETVTPNSHNNYKYPPPPFHKLQNLLQCVSRPALCNLHRPRMPSSWNFVSRPGPTRLHRASKGGGGDWHQYNTWSNVSNVGQ